MAVVCGKAVVCGWLVGVAGNAVGTAGGGTDVAGGGATVLIGALVGGAGTVGVAHAASKMPLTKMATIRVLMLA